jgi:phosphoglucomutase
LDEAIQSAVEAWLNDPAIAEQDKDEVRELLERGEHQELTDRFYRELEFGTGGMRGLMGAGLNRMNVYTVGAAAQGLANYISRQGEAEKKAGVAIAFDCRRNSELFARTTAEVLAGNGITVHLFEKLRPTPQLSFAVRRLGCTAGVVITASHNPPEYNGFKAYWSDGGGVVPPHDKNIIAEVRAVGGFGNIRRAEFMGARPLTSPSDVKGRQDSRTSGGTPEADGLIRLLGDDMDQAFIDAVQGSCLEPDAVRRHGPGLGIVYTALHGTGGTLIPEALWRRGFERVWSVPEQAEPDGEFSTVASPNPEEAPALDMAVALAVKEGAALVIGTDPDGDRMGIAARNHEGEFELLTGNQTAALLTWYICEHHRRAGTFPSNAAVLSTIVSGDMMKDIARRYGAEVIETLTGFKWIGEKVTQFEQEGTPDRPARTYLFGAEESYGYMPCTYTRDKDAVTSAAYIADLAAVLAADGRTLHGLLMDLYREYGYYQEYTLNVTLPGKEGADRIKAMMANLRENPPTEVAGEAVASVGDLTSGEIRGVDGGRIISRYDLPAADVIVLTLQGGTKLIARPSGTEPKIKFYILTREPGDDLELAKSTAASRIEAIKAVVSSKF